MDWLDDEFNLTKIFENEDMDTSIVDDYILKRDPLLVSDLDTGGYDYIIRLIRENTVLAAESDLWAQEKQKYHPDNNEKYIIDEDFLINNHEHIWRRKMGYDELNDTISHMDVGILVTYEEIFIHGTGQEKIENYMGFKSNSRLNTDDKKGRLHVMDKTLHTTYDIEYEKFKYTIKEMENLINMKNAFINHLVKEKESITKNKDTIINDLMSLIPKKMI
jgi:hypothetical protein